MHGQHEHQTLLDPATHLGLLDAFGGLAGPAQATAAAYESMRGVRDDLDRALRAAADRESRQDLLSFQLGELDKIAPKPGEDEELAARRQVLASAERVERLCAESYQSLYESDGAILASLGGVWRRVGELAALDPQFQPYLDARDAVKAQLEDLAGFLRRYADGIEASPERLHQVEDRLAQLERLKRKYGPRLEDVIARREAIRQELSDLERSDERVSELHKQYAAIREQFLAQAGALAAERRRAAVRLASELERLLAELAMAETRFEVRFNKEPLAEGAWSGQGIDQAECYVSPNPGEELRPLARIVSGGELSRIMLAIKTLTATSRYGFSTLDERPPSASAPGLIFDEVDAGIGGRVADVVGRKLRTLGSAFQVLCITHLPQIAAAADTHYQIEKRVNVGRTRTSVRRLDDAGRVEEIARMLGGESITEGVRETARELIGQRRGAAASSTPGNDGPGRGGAKGETKSKGESESRKAKASTARQPRRS
jgi:DNA repair protein RecN (Recombination protein N)